MKPAICNEIFTDWPLDRIADFVRPLGYEGIEISPFTLGSNPIALSRGDRIHLMPAGYEQLGDAVASALVSAYEARKP